MTRRRVDGMFANVLTVNAVAKGVALVNAGFSWSAAAKEVGMCTDSLRKRARRDGLKFRRGKRAFCKPSRLNLPTEATDLAYLAGILDGEGSITIAESPRNVVRLGIANTNVELMKWLLSIGGGISECQRKANQKSQTPCYHWQIYSRIDVRSFLAAVVPYMRIKRAKAELAIEVISSWVREQEDNSATLQEDISQL